ncbi:MAG: hypothetical protein L3K09_07500, partial [Thermoplasmata archaeon]|nr:hypothetical protein [Thermoplasmata archaeon]
GARIVTLRGSYRDRSTPYSGLAGLSPSVPGFGEPGSKESPGAAPPEPTEEPEAPVQVPIAGIAYAQDDNLPSRRGRGAPQRMTFMGVTYSARRRGAQEVNPAEYWAELTAEFRAAQPHPVAILVEDASLLDFDSRDVLLYLSERARLVPLVLIYVLDISLPVFGAWEERLLGRGDVDWVRFDQSKPDPREAHRIKTTFETLPPESQRVLGYAALMGGVLSEVSLSRVTRLSWSQLADALAPVTEAGLLKVQMDKVTIPHQVWLPLLPELFTDKQRKEMHRDIADALAALSPEPSLERRRELAEHYLLGEAGPVALRYLLETAELTERLMAFDSAEELLEKAIRCVPSLPPAARALADAELRILHARTLLYSGRPSEGERELHEGVTLALNAKVGRETLEEWIEPMVPALSAVGPRPSLMTALVEIADRCHDAGAATGEILFQSVIAEFEVDRGRSDKSRVEAHRAARLARATGYGPSQALALLAVALSRVGGNPDEREMAARFLDSAQILLSEARRHSLAQHVEEVQVRLNTADGELGRARHARERLIPVAQRSRQPVIELYHQLGLAELLLDAKDIEHAAAPLKRATEICETLHLLPPSLALLRCWLLQGRMHALTDQPDRARDYWEAIVERPHANQVPSLRAEALLRLAMIEVASGHEEAAQHHVKRLRARELAGAIRLTWALTLSEMRDLNPSPATSGGPLPR